MGTKQALTTIIMLILMLVSASAIDYAPNNYADPTGSLDQLYDAQFAPYPNTGDTATFTREGVTTALQAHALQFSNDLNQIQSISMPQSVQLNTQDNTYFYPDAYGTGITLSYAAQKTMLKEELTINQFTDLPAVQQYVLDGGNAVIELAFVLTQNSGKLYLDQAEWDQESETDTQNDVVVTNSQDQELYRFQAPIAVDANGATSQGTFRFKKSAQKLYVTMRFPYSFLQSAAYPVRLDPTFTVDYSPEPARYLVNGTPETDPDAAFETEYNVTAQVTDNNTATAYELYQKSDSAEISLHTTSTGSTLLNSVNFVAANIFNLTDYPGTTAVHMCVEAYSSKGTPSVYAWYDNVNTLIPIPLTGVNGWHCVDFNVTPTGSSMYIGMGCTTCGASNQATIQQGNSPPFYGYQSTTGGTIYSAQNKNFHINVTLTHSHGAVMSGFWTQDYTPLYEHWFIRFYKTTPGTQTFNAVAYSNLTHVNSTLNASQAFTGTGWFNLNVTQQVMNDQTNYTSFRLYSETPSNVSELYLRAEVNDTTVPQIENCTVNDTSLTNYEVARFECTVTDDIDVDYVNGTISGNENTWTKNVDQYYYDFNCTAPTYGNNTLTLVEAYDIVGNYNSTSPGTWTYCDFCIEDWTANWVNTSCDTDDTYWGFVYYTDDNACGTTGDLPIDNGTNSSYVCDYCQPLVLSTESQCYNNGTKFLYYQDFNYYICCAITGLVSDCPTDYTLINNTATSCEYFNNTMSCEADPAPYMGVLRDKMYWLCEVPVSNESFVCNSYVKKDGNVQQVNPRYRDLPESGFLSLREQEERQHFQAQNGLVTVYFDDYNIVPYTQFRFEVKCTGSQGTQLSYGQLTTPTVPDAGQWGSGWLIGVNENMNAIIGISFVVIFLTAAIFIFANRGGRR